MVIHIEKWNKTAIHGKKVCFLESLVIQSSSTPKNTPLIQIRAQ